LLYNSDVFLSKLSVENKLTLYKAMSLGIWHQVMGMQQIIQHKNTPNLSIKTPQDDNRCPLVRLKSNIAQRPQDPV
jgi:hypothetical protein